MTIRLMDISFLKFLINWEETLLAREVLGGRQYDTVLQSSKDRPRDNANLLGYNDFRDGKSARY